MKFEKIKFIACKLSHSESDVHDVFFLVGSFEKSKMQLFVCMCLLFGLERKNSLCFFGFNET